MAMSRTLRATIDLYRKMPGTPTPIIEDGERLLSDMHGDAHWEFCAEIVAQIDAATKPNPDEM